MTRMGKHSPAEETVNAAPPRRDHLWVLVIVAACALLEVWASWVTIGSMSGFPRIGHIPTDWTLAVTTETYWAYALYSWLAAAPGPRSRRFAMWSAGGVFALSLVGQGASHLVARGTVPPPALVVFVTALPVTILALIAVLIHLRHTDRAEAVEAAGHATREAERAAAEEAKADERTALRADLEALREELQAAETARSEAAQETANMRAQVGALTRKAEQDVAEHAERETERAAAAEAAADDLAALRAEVEALQDAHRAAEEGRDEALREAENVRAKADKLTRKVAALSGSGRTRNGRAKNPANGGRKRADSPPETQVPDDFDAQAEALTILADEPGISGAKLGERVGKSERWGQLLKSSLAAADKPDGGDA